MWAHATPVMLYALSMISEFTAMQVRRVGGEWGSSSFGDTGKPARLHRSPACFPACTADQQKVFVEAPYRLCLCASSLSALPGCLPPFFTCRCGRPSVSTSS